MVHARAIIFLLLISLGAMAQPFTASELAWHKRILDWSCDLVNPPMTSSNTPSGFATGTYSIDYGASTAPWKAFDQRIEPNSPPKAASLWNARWPGYLQYQFPTPQVVRSYSIYVTAGLKQPTNWTLQTSTNGVDWLVQDTQSNILWTAVDYTNSVGVKYFSITNESAYSYYKFDVSFVTNYHQVEVLELELNGCRR